MQRSASLRPNRSLWVVVSLRTYAEVAALAALIISVGCAKGDVEDPPAAKPGADAAVTVELWDGVPPLVSETEDLALELRPQAGPLPPPSVGETIELPFPPPAVDSAVAPTTDPELARGPLEVLRFGPTGAQGAIDSVSIVFSQPMVPLAATDELRQEAIPFEIEPAPPGEVRWLGTDALAYQVAGRFPFSTTYRVKVPSGTTSIHGRALPKATEWSFTTPSLAIEVAFPPEGAIGALLETPIVLRFNQAIRAEELVEAGLELRAGRESVDLEVIPHSGWGSLEGAALAATEGVDSARVLVVRPTSRLRPDTRYSLRIPGGAFGEGPNPAKAQSLRFATYPPLRIEGTSCAPEGCSPSHGIHLGTSTPLRPIDEGLEELVTVSPKVEGLRVRAGYGLQLRGKFEGASKYTVTVDPGLRDIYGQEMSGVYRGVVKTSAYEPQLELVGGAHEPAVLERRVGQESPRSLAIQVAGVSSVEFRSRALSEDELGTFLGNRWFDVEKGWPSDVPPPVGFEEVATPTAKRAPTRVELDLGAMLEAGKTLYLTGRTSPFSRWGYVQRLGLSRFIEVTDLGITAALDRDSGTVLITSMESGEPLAGVGVELRRRSSGEVSWRGTTDERGLVEVSVRGVIDNDGFLYASRGDDVAFLPLERDLSGSWWGRESAGDEPRGFIYSEREPYKPGETAHLSGIVRSESSGPAGTIELWRTGATATYSVSGPRGHQIAQGQAKLSSFGTFSFDVSIPESADLGVYGVNVELPAGLLGRAHTFAHEISVENYRTPEFEVSVEREEAAALVFGDMLRAELRGAYLHGAPLVGGDVRYTIRRSETGFTPPGAENRDFTFGVGSPDVWRGMGGRWGEPSPGGDTLVAEGEGSLDERGVFVALHAVKALEVGIQRSGEGVATPPSQPGSKGKRGASKTPVVAASYTVEATVTDQNRQSITGRETFVVHPALRYIGLRSDRQVYREGEQAKVEAVVVDLEGARIPDVPLGLELIREETRRTVVERDGQWIYEYTTDEVEAGGCTPISGGGPASCELALGKPGTYSLRATVRDEAGRAQESRRTFYVHGDDAVIWEQDQQRVDLVADRRSYEPGDTAKLLIRSPFDEARGLLVVEREGIVETRPLKVEGGTATVELPVDASMIPNLHVAAVLDRGRIEVVGAPPEQDLGRPAQAFGATELEVSRASKRVVVELTPDREELAPKETLRLRVRTKTRDGEVLPAAVAVMVVDEGVLSLMGYETPDPLKFFHREREAGVRVFDLRSFLLRRTPEVPADAAEMNGAIPGPDVVEEAVAYSVDRPGAPKPTDASAYGRAYAFKVDDAGDKERDRSGYVDANQRGPAPSEVSLRSLFASTAYFNPEVMTDERGEAVVEIPMPENLSAFRVMAVAVDTKVADRFGSADTRVRVRKPIMIRPSLPRFANYGDRFDASVMVDNQTDAAQAIEVGARALGVKVGGEGRSRVEIPAGESREVRFPMSADEVGRARVQFAALAKGGRDATEVTFPIQVPATRQAFATYGVTESSIAQLVKAPLDALPGFGGLELSLSSTALAGLEDATRYLLDYDYECTEQTASRLLPIFVLGPVLEGFSIADGADTKRRTTIAEEGIRRLLSRQNGDGGFRLWDTNGQSWPYVSAWATFALLEGKEAGFAVEERALVRALRYLEGYITRPDEPTYGRTYDWTSRAFALWLLSREGRGAEHFAQVWSHRADLPVYAQAWMLSAAHRFKRTEVSERLRGELVRLATEDAKVAHFVERRSEGFADGLQTLMHSSVQTDAIVLMALLEVAPEDPLLPKVIAGIMADRDPREGGRWSTTHANAWALLAANRYFRAVEKTIPEFVARIFLGEEYAGAQEFSGRSLAVTEQRIPMRSLQATPERLLTLAKEGAGKLYYRVGLRYAPADLTIGAEDQGFVVSRSYEAVALGSGAVSADAVRQASDGSWEIKAGELVRVSLTVVARDRASYVVVDDPLPAGLEGQNPRFDTSLRDVDAELGAGRGDDGGAFSWWRRWWRWDHVELRDDRLLLFADRLPAGIYTYSYLARATTIGEFQLPPVHAEGMYAPERYGHSASTVVRVVE